MTAEQLEQWNHYACGSRCVIKLAEIRGKKVTRDTFIDKFYERYHEIWVTHLGLARTSEIIECSKDLGLCSGAKTLRSIDTVVDFVLNNGTRGVFVLTELSVDAKTGELKNESHCRLLWNKPAIGADWDLFHPDASGEDILERTSIGELEKELAHFIVLD